MFSLQVWSLKPRGPINMRKISFAKTSLDVKLRSKLLVYLPIVALFTDYFLSLPIADAN